MFENLVAVRCGECNVLFGMEEHHHDHRRSDGRDFWCPNGHVIAFKDSREKVLARQLMEETEARRRAEKERDLLAKKLDRVRNRRKTP